jgi:DNA repair protein RadC
VADGKLIFNYGLESKASGIILAHNHPSGNVKPSAADMNLTEALKKFGSYIDIQILDHLIVSGNNYFSFADEGRL